MKALVSVLLLIGSIGTYAQSSSGNLQDHLTSYLESIPGDLGDDYQVPGTAEIE